MDITAEQARAIVTFATSYLGQRYHPGFTCVDFVREVYRGIGITIPELSPEAPPSRFNLSPDDIGDPPIGHLLFLRNKQEKRDRRWSHIVIVLPDRECIHCSYFTGQVTRSTLPDILSRYEIVPSPA